MKFKNLLPAFFCLVAASSSAQLITDEQLDKANEFIGGSLDIDSESLKRISEKLQMPTSEQMLEAAKKINQINPKAISDAAKSYLGRKMPTYKGMADEKERQDYSDGVKKRMGHLSRNDYLNSLLEKYDKAQKKVLGQAKNEEGSVPKESLFIFVSFSMPDTVIENLSRQAAYAGATLVLRGMVDGSLAKTKQVAQKVNKYGSPWQIHPELFELFKVKSVPTFVLTGDKEVVDQGCLAERTKECSIQNSYASVSGDLSVKLALDTIQRNSDTPFISSLAKKKIMLIEQNEAKRNG